jgi:hypothetical protein
LGWKVPLSFFFFSFFGGAGGGGYAFVSMSFHSCEA